MRRWIFRLFRTRELFVSCETTSFSRTVLFIVIELNCQRNCLIFFSNLLCWTAAHGDKFKCVAHAVHKDRLENWSRALIWLRGLDYCLLTGHKPGFLLACLLDITPWGDIYISWGYVMTPFVGNVVVRRKPQSTFCVSVRLNLTQACLSGFLLFGPGGHKGARHGGHLEPC